MSSPSSASYDIIYGNLKEWVADFEIRLATLEPDMKVRPSDDYYAKTNRNLAAVYVNTYIKTRMAQKEEQLATNNAYTQSWQQYNEYYLNLAGRLLYGAGWSARPCGAGFVSYQAGCGAKST